MHANIYIMQTDKIYIPVDKHNDGLETAITGAKARTCVPIFETKTRNSRKENEAAE
jgi:hypothetical protein